MVAVSSVYTLQAENSGIAIVEALNSGFHLAFIGAAVVVAAAAVVAFVAVKKANSPQASSLGTKPSSNGLSKCAFAFPSTCFI